MFIGAHTKKTEKKQFGFPKAGGAQKNRSIKLSLRKQLASLRLRGDERSDERIDERITQLRKYLQKSDFIRSDKEEAVMRAELKDLEQLELKRGVTSKKVHYVIGEVARESFMTEPSLVAK